MKPKHIKKALTILLTTAPPVDDADKQRFELEVREKLMSAGLDSDEVANFFLRKFKIQTSDNLSTEHTNVDEVDS